MKQEIQLDDDAIYRKIAWHIIPFLFICDLVNFIDRVNVGFAKLQFLQDLNLNEAVYGLAAGAFFIGYAVFEVPSSLLLTRIGIRKTFFRIMVLWGVFTLLLLFVRSANMLYVLRFLVGAAEAGFYPGLIAYLTYWFPDGRRARMNSLVLVAVPLASIIGGPLAGLIMSHLNGHMGLRGWQWLFLIEGTPAIILGLLALVCLRDGPEQAHWLNDDERARINAALQIERRRRGEHVNSAVRFRELLLDPKILLLCVIYFTIYMGLSAISFWLPTVLRRVGMVHVSDIGWAGVIAACTLIGNLVISRSSDRRAERRWHIAGCGIAAAVCLLLLPFAAHYISLTAVLLTIAQIGMFTVPLIFWTIPAVMLDSRLTAGGIAIINSIGAIGAAASSSLVGVVTTYTGDLYIGLASIAIPVIVGMVLLLTCVPSDCAVSEVGRKKNSAANPPLKNMSVDPGSPTLVDKSEQS